MLLYRIEHHDAEEGPSWECLWDTVLTEAAIADGLITADDLDGTYEGYYHTPERGFPSPADDTFDREPSRGMMCACDSAAELFRWFSPTMCRELRDRGYVLRCFRVPEYDVCLGRHQALFWRELHEPVAEYDPVADRERLLADNPLPIAA